MKASGESERLTAELNHPEASVIWARALELHEISSLHARAIKLPRCHSRRATVEPLVGARKRRKWSQRSCEESM